MKYFKYLHSTGHDGTRLSVKCLLAKAVNAQVTDGVIKYICITCIELHIENILFLRFLIETKLFAVRSRPKQKTLLDDVIVDEIERFINDVILHHFTSDVDVIKRPHVSHVT